MKNVLFQFYYANKNQTIKNLRWSFQVDIVLNKDRSRVGVDGIEMLLPVLQSDLNFLSMQLVCLCTLVVLQLTNQPAPLRRCTVDW